MIRPAVFLLAGLLALPALADIYSWVDKNGVVHYADMPPATGEVKVIQSSKRKLTETGTTAPPADDGASAEGEDNEDPAKKAAREKALRERAARQAAMQDKAQQAAQRDNAERERFCDQAAGQLAGLKSGQRFVRFNAAGEREVLSDQARAEEIDRLEKQISENCQ